jgi:hypothetical protein
MSISAAIALLPLGLLVGRVALVLSRVTWRLLVWLVEEPEGVTDALVRLGAIGVLLHGVGLL